MEQRHFAYWPKRRPREFPVPATSVAHNLATSAARWPDHPAIVYYDTPIAYARLWREVEALAGHLEHEAGVKRGDRVLLHMQNSPQFVIAYYAILRANAVVVPLNPMLVAEELDLALPAAVAAPAAPVEGDGWVRFADAVRGTAVPSSIVTGGDDMALLLYTSGTTGRPKGCVHTHRSVQTTTWATPMWGGSTGPGARILSVLPYFHVTGMTGDMNAGLCNGATIVMMTRWDPATALTLIERYRCTGMTAISTMVVDLLSHPGYRAEALASLVALGGGGAPLPAAVGTELSERLGMNYMEGYGLTETIAMTHANPPDRTKLQCLGVPTFGIDSRVVDPETLRELGPNETGEIVIAGSQVMREYWKQPEATAEAFIERDGKRFLRTGDLGYADDEGYFFLVDRVKRMINAGGFKVWPAEVETKLFGHPAIKEACVIASIDARLGEQVKALVVLRDGASATADEIIAWAREHMAAYKLPREIAFVDALPRGPTGKVQWRALQEEEQRRAAQVAAPS